MTCSTTSAPWSNASTPGSRTNLALGSCACAAPSRSNAISCSASSPSPSIKYSACPRCKKLRVDQLAAQVSEKSRASQIMQEAPWRQLSCGGGTARESDECCCCPVRWERSGLCRPNINSPPRFDDVTEVWRALRAQVDGPIFLAGDSAEGGLSVVLLMNLRDRREQGPSAACLFSPWTDLAVTGASVTTNRDRDPMQVANVFRMLAAAYLGEADPRAPLASPIYGDFVGLPPLSIFVGDTEILLDDSRRLAERARLAGVTVDLRIYPDMPHAWPLLNMIMPEGRQAMDEATAFLQASALRGVGALGAASGGI